MKKAMLILVAACMTSAANAKILRVSNVSGSSAPYSSIEAAQNAAESGDTIMIDASSNSYGAVTLNINKQLVLIGPGYFLVENEIVAEGASSASLGKLTIMCEGTVVKGLEISSVDIQAPKAIVNRCKVGAIALNADNCIIHQNYITGAIDGGDSRNQTQYHQITNNILNSNASFVYYSISYIGNSYIAYNTSKLSSINFNGVKNSTIEYNIANGFKKDDNYSDNSFHDNYTTSLYNTNLKSNSIIDKDYFEIELPTEDQGKYGAFAGNSPYVLAGVPSGPVIQDLIVPTTVEMGSKMNVTVKIGMVK